jgi:hypothetical protein
MYFSPTALRRWFSATALIEAIGSPRDLPLASRFTPFFRGRPISGCVPCFFAYRRVVSDLSIPLPLAGCELCSRLIGDRALLYLGRWKCEAFPIDTPGLGFFAEHGRIESEGTSAVRQIELLLHF